MAAFHFNHERPVGETECLQVCHADIFLLLTFIAHLQFLLIMSYEFLTAFMPLKLKLWPQISLDQHIIISHIAGELEFWVPQVNSVFPICTCILNRNK